MRSLYRRKSCLKTAKNTKKRRIAVILRFQSCSTFLFYHKFMFLSSKSRVDFFNKSFKRLWWYVWLFGAYLVWKAVVDPIWHFCPAIL